MKTNHRILAIDYGEKRVGVAVTDPLSIFATGLETLNADDSLIPQLKKITADYDVKEIIVGLPLTLKGEKGSAANQVIQFVDRLQKEISIPIILRDERFTSSLATQTIRDLGVGKKKRREKGKVDEIAAVILLQDYLRS